MKFYKQHLEQQGYNVEYIDSTQTISDVKNLIPHLANKQIDVIYYADTTDN